MYTRFIFPCARRRQSNPQYDAAAVNLGVNMSSVLFLDCLQQTVKNTAVMVVTHLSIISEQSRTVSSPFCERWWLDLRTKKKLLFWPARKKGKSGTNLAIELHTRVPSGYRFKAKNNPTKSQAYKKGFW